MNQPLLPIVCTLQPAAFAQRRTDLLDRVRAHVREQRVLDDGVALRFDGDPAHREDLLEVVRLERQCCAFLTIRLTVSPAGGPLWLELTGPPGTASCIRDEMGLAT